MKNTVKDLIELLESVEDKNLIVHMEGCDCFQTFGGKVRIDEYKYLLLENDGK